MNIEDYSHEAILDELTPEDKDVILNFANRNEENSFHVLNNISVKAYRALVQLLESRIDYTIKRIRKDAQCTYNNYRN